MEAFGAGVGGVAGRAVGEVVEEKVGREEEVVAGRVAGAEDVAAGVGAVAGAADEGGGVGVPTGRDGAVVGSVVALEHFFEPGVGLDADVAVAEFPLAGRAGAAEGEGGGPGVALGGGARVVEEFSAEGDGKFSGVARGVGEEVGDGALGEKRAVAVDEHAGGGAGVAAFIVRDVRRGERGGVGEGEVGKAEGRGPGGLPLGEPTRAGGEEERVAGGGSEVVEDVLAATRVRRWSGAGVKETSSVAPSGW